MDDEGSRLDPPLSNDPMSIDGHWTFRALTLGAIGRGNRIHFRRR